MRESPVAPSGICQAPGHGGNERASPRRSANGMVRPCSCPASRRSWRGAPRQGARHVSDTQYRDRRDRDRLRSGHFRSECMRIMGGGTSVVASATGNVGRQASATKSSASNTPPTQRKYRARGICNSTPRFGRCSEMRHRSAMTSGLSDRTALTHRPPEGCHPSFFKEDAPYSLWP